MADNDWWRTNVNTKEGPEEYSRRVGIIRSRRKRLDSARDKKRERDAAMPRAPVQPTQPTAPVQPPVVYRERPPAPTQPPDVQQVVSQPPTPETQATVAEITAARTRTLEPPPITPPTEPEPGTPAAAWAKAQPGLEWWRRVGADFLGGIKKGWYGDQPEEKGWWEAYSDPLQEALRASDQEQYEGTGAISPGGARNTLGRIFGPPAGAVGAAFEGEEGAVASTLFATDRTAREAEGWYDLTQEEQYALARRAHSYGQGERLDAMWAGPPEDATKQEMFDWITTPSGPQRAQELLEEDIAAIQAGADPYEVGANRYNVSAELMGGAALSLLNIGDVFEVAGIGSRVSHRGRKLEKARELALSGATPKHVEQLREYRRALMEAEAGVQANAAADAMAEAREGVKPIERSLLKQAFLTNTAEMKKIQADAYDALATALTTIDNTADAQDFIRAMADDPESLVPKYGQQILGPKGQALTEVLKVMDSPADNIIRVAEDPDTHELIHRTLNPKNAMQDFIPASDEALQKAYNVGGKVTGKDPVSLARRFANFQRGIISELWLNAYLRPGYAVQNAISDAANLVFDGVNPFRKVDLDEVRNLYGDMHPKLTEGLSKSDESPWMAQRDASVFEQWVPKPLRKGAKPFLKVSKGGVDYSRKLEEGRVARTFYDQTETALNFLTEANMPGLPDDLAAWAGPLGDEIRKAIMEGRNRKEKFDKVRAILDENNPPLMSIVSDLSDEQRASLPAGFARDMRERINPLGRNATAQQVEQEFAAYRHEVRQGYSQQMVEQGPARPTRVNNRATEADDAVDSLEDLAQMVVSGEGGPNLQRVLEVMNERAVVTTQALSDANQALGDAAVAINTPESRDVVVYVYQKLNELRRAARQAQDNARRTVYEMIEAGRVEAKPAWARHRSETIPNIWADFAELRLQLYNEAMGYLRGFAAGQPWEAVVPVSRAEVASGTMARLEGVPTRDTGYIAQRISLEGWPDYAAYLERERALVDFAMEEAWIAASRQDPYLMSAMLDEIYGTIGDVGYRNRQDAARVDEILEQANVTTERMKRTNVSQERINEFWQRTRREVQLIWQKARSDQVSWWNETRDAILSGNLSLGPRNSSMPSVNAAQQANDARRAAQEGVEAAEEVAEEATERGHIIPPATPGQTRLYRAGGVDQALPEQEWLVEQLRARGVLDARGRWWTDDYEKVLWYADEYETNEILSLEIPTDLADTYRVTGSEVARFSKDPDAEFYIPRETARQGTPLQTVEQAQRAQTATGVGANSATLGAVGDADIGAQALTESETATLDAIDTAAQNVVGSWGEGWQLDLGNREMRGEMLKWFNDEVVPQHLDDLAQAKTYAVGMTNDAMLDYEAVGGIDIALNMMFPYTYWYTRTGRNWARRISRRPAILANYLRMKDRTQEINESQGRRGRFERKVHVPLPEFVQEAFPMAGETLAFDPATAFLPFASAARWDWDNHEEGAKGVRAFMNTAGEYGFRTFPAYEILYESGMLRSGLEKAGLPQDQAQWFGPALEGDVGYQFPLTAPIQAASAVASPYAEGTPLEQFLPREGWNIEAWPREKLNLPQGEFYQPYRTTRMAGNLGMFAPQDTDYARAGVMAAELGDRWEADKQRSRPWEAGDPLALEYQKEYGLTDEELKAAQDYLAQSVGKAAMERALPQITGWATGMPVSIEPRGEAFQIGLQKTAQSLGFPQDPEGSREAVSEFKKAFPVGYIRQEQYGALPGEVGDEFTATHRGNWLKRQSIEAELYPRYEREMDETLSQQPWNKDAYDEIKARRKAELGKMEERYPLPEGDPDIPILLPGMNENEGWNSLVNSWYYDQEGEPSQSDYDDYDKFERDHERWVNQLELPAEIEGGDYAGMTAPQAYEYHRQRHSTPLEALFWTYRERIRNPAWDAYHEAVDGGAEKWDAWDETMGKVRAMPAETLIPAVIEDYQGRWSADELRQAYQGVEFIALEDQTKKD